MPHLTVVNGPNHGLVVPIKAGVPFRAGRDPALELCLDDSKASRTHVQLEWKDKRFILRDLRSKNGTLVNDIAISTVTLSDGDEIKIGETTLLFSLQDLPAPNIRTHHDSAMAPRLPVGVVERESRKSKDTETYEGEGFETLALDEPLPLLRLQEDVDGKPDETSAGTLVSTNSLERANRGLRALFGIAKACADADHPQELLVELAEQLESALEADRVTPILLDGKNGWKVAERQAEGGDGKDAGGAKVRAAFNRVPVSRTIVEYAIKTQRSVLTAPLSDERFEEARSIGEQGITSALCVPLIAEEKLLGLIYADRLGGVSFDRAEQELLTAACLQAGPALFRLRHLQDVLERKERLLSELKEQHRMLGQSAEIKETHNFITRAAPTDSVVLILGESGTGKELVARAIHYQSNRKDGPFIIVNCAALSESLIESELFGHIKGAFTGASSERKGRFELAHQGTIFMDEIGELSKSCQTKLLRVLEQGEVSRVGEARVRKVDVRLIAATNRDLASDVKDGQFREDLFYRLNVLAVQLPPLRARGKDIGLLAEHYLADAAGRCARPRMKFSDEVLAVLNTYRWPGNVRELRNFTERLAVLAPQEIIGVRDLPAEMSTKNDPVLLNEEGLEVEAKETKRDDNSVAGGTPRPLAEVEKEHVLSVLSSCAGNKKQAAEVLGIDRSTLYAKLRAYGYISDGNKAT